jgi:endoglucanase
MDKIAVTGGQAKWFGDWNTDVQASVDKYVTAVAAAGATPVMVAYNIPNRDCGQYSSGGAAGEAAYRDWIRRFALGIARRPAIVVLEPDALGHLSQCGTDAEKQQRVFLLWDAVQVLKADPLTRVYIDVGHSRWLSPAVAADRLAQAGVADADGFATNVSNFNPTANEVAYGDGISSLLGGKHFVVDTSRNGLGPASTWCNPSGQALGKRPTTATGSANVDAFLWIKHPGQSDGTCNGGPAAGTWWPDYALGLAQRAAY